MKATRFEVYTAGSHAVLHATTVGADPGKWVGTATIDAGMSYPTVLEAKTFLVQRLRELADAIEGKVAPEADKATPEPDK